MTATSARHVTGDAGDDTITVRAGSILGVSGGTGNDRIVLDNTAGAASTIYMAEGDGHDTVETNSDVIIRRFSADGAGIRAGTPSLTRNDDGTATLQFGDGGDSITVRFTGTLAGRDIAMSLQPDGTVRIGALQS